jgi:EAL domain-containing protein (putative c-di-GMP-specific phosphodiesterase class I)
MYPVFQLKYSREKGTYYGAEILCRWKNPELGNVSPSIFIPIAEKTGLIMDISKFIVDEAFKAHQKIIRHYHHHFMLSINLSNRELTDRDFFNYFVEKAKEYDLAPKFIGIEITERELIDHMEVIREYHEYGVSIIVDDFGVDYSALNLLTYDFIDTVKIDKSFVTEMVSNRRTYMMLKHIVQLIGYLGLNCIIEGIETEEQLDLLQGIGIDNIQGFYFSKPSVFEDIVAQITKTAS